MKTMLTTKGPNLNTSITKFNTSSSPTRLPSIPVTEERNFRSYYYEKMGFRVVEEKKSLEILLKERPMDKTKLHQFALRFLVPSVHRQLLWRMLLGVVPLYMEHHDFVRERQQEQFDDLQHAVHCIIPDHAQFSKAELMTWIKFLNDGKLKVDYLYQLTTRDGRALVHIGQSLCDAMENDQDAFWIMRGFADRLKSFRRYIPVLILYVDKLIHKVDEQLHSHLKQYNILESLPLEEWMDCCFSSIFRFIPMQRLWDKVIGGSVVVMVFFIVAMFSSMKMAVLNVTCAEKLLDHAKELSDSTVEIIVTQAIEYWQQHGCPVLPGSIVDANMRDTLKTPCFSFLKHSSVARLNAHYTKCRAAKH